MKHATLVVTLHGSMLADARRVATLALGGAAGDLYAAQIDGPGDRAGAEGLCPPPRSRCTPVSAKPARRRDDAGTETALIRLFWRSRG